MKKMTSSAVTMNLRCARCALITIMLLVISISSYAVTCITLVPDPNNPNDPDTVREAPESIFIGPPPANIQYTEAQIPGPTVDAKTTERTVFLDYPGVPGGYFGAILSDGQTAFAYKDTDSKPVKVHNKKPIVVATWVKTLNAVTANNPSHLRITFKQGHLVNSWVGGNPVKTKGYTLLTEISNPNHEAVVESFMKEANRQILNHYFNVTFIKATANDFVARGPNAAGQTVQYSPAYYYEMIVDHTQTVWDLRQVLMPSWQQMGFTQTHLKKLPAYYDMTIRFVMEEYANGQPTGDVYNMPDHVFNQFLTDTGLTLPDFAPLPGSYQLNGYHFRANNPVIGTQVNPANQEVNFRLYNYGR